MATPPTLITTVNGRRCTRSHARAAPTFVVIAKASAAAISTLPTTLTSPQLPQLQGIAADPQPSLPSGSLSTPNQRTAAAVLIDSFISPTAVPTLAAASYPPEISPPATSHSESQFSTLSTSLPYLVSTALATAGLPPSDNDFSALARQSPTSASTTSYGPTSLPLEILPLDHSTRDTTASSLPTNPAVDIPSPSTIHGTTPLPAGPPAGAMVPKQGAHGGDAAHHTFGIHGTNADGIVGGIVGGLVGLILLGGLVFFCLRKRKLTLSGKGNIDSSTVSKAKSIPTIIRVSPAKMPGEEAGSINYPFQQHTSHPSASSVYSLRRSRRNQSLNDPQDMFAVQRGGPPASLAVKGEGTAGPRKKLESMSSEYRFPDVPEDYNLQKQGVDQVSQLITPQPAVMPLRLSSDPFASIFDQIEAMPSWLRDSTMTTTTDYTRAPTSASLLDARDFNAAYFDAGVLGQAQTSSGVFGQERQGPSVYSTSAMSPGEIPRPSQFAFSSGTRSSRPGTTAFTPGLFTGRTVRQSDPFDLDRPEVLGLSDA